MENENNRKININPLKNFKLIKQIKLNNIKDKQQVLDNLTAISKKLSENNKILKSIRNHNRLGMIFKLFYIFLFIGSAFGLWYFIQPMIENIFGTYSKIQDVTNNLSGQSINMRINTNIIFNLSRLLNSLKK